MTEGSTEPYKNTETHPTHIYCESVGSPSDHRKYLVSGAAKDNWKDELF
jgi:hypothetical protein